MKWRSVRSKRSRGKYRCFGRAKVGARAPPTRVFRSRRIETLAAQQPCSQGLLRFQERGHLRDAERNSTDASKTVARHFNLPNHSHHNMTICGLSLHHGNTESRKNLEQKFIFQLGTLSPQGINKHLSFH